MGEAKRKREQTIRALAAEVGGDMDLAQHMYDNQIRTQQRVAEVRERGHEAEAAFVDTDPNATGGTLVSCHGCGRTARIYMDVAPDKVVLCPRCQRERLGG